MKPKTAAESYRLKKDIFYATTAVSAGWEQDVPHPLYAYMHYGDMHAIAKIVGCTSVYVRMLLRGHISWSPAEGRRGDKKRTIIWRAQAYVWARIALGATDLKPTEKPMKGSRRLNA